MEKVMHPFNPSFLFDELIDPANRKCLIDYLAAKYLGVGYTLKSSRSLVFVCFVLTSSLSCLNVKLQGYDISEDDDRKISELAYDALCAFQSELSAGNSISSKLSWLAGRPHKFIRLYHGFFGKYSHYLKKLYDEKKISDRERDLLISELTGLLRDINGIEKTKYYPASTIKMLLERNS
jgi:hypothetical protein